MRLRCFQYLPFLFIVTAQLYTLPAIAQGDSRPASCYDKYIRKDCYARQTFSQLAGNSGYHLIANWADGDTTEIFIPLKNSRDNTIYGKINGSEWMPAEFSFCDITTANVRYVMARWGDNGTGCMPDFMPNY